MLLCAKSTRPERDAAHLRPGRRLSLKGVGGARRGDGGGCDAVIAFVVGSAVTVWGRVQAARTASWWV